MIIQMTGKVSIDLCNWIYDEIRKGKFNRAKLNKLLTLAMKYNTNNENDSKRWVYNSDDQTFDFYNGSVINKKIWFKDQLYCEIPILWNKNKEI